MLLMRAKMRAILMPALRGAMICGMMLPRVGVIIKGVVDMLLTRVAIDYAASARCWRVAVDSVETE